MTARPPIIVTGLPRSGTSLAMQILAAGGVPPLTDHQRTPDTDNPRGYFEFERVKQLKTDKGWLDEARGRAVKVVHMLLAELPDDRDYLVIFMRRDVGEVVQSQAAMLARSGRPGAGLPAGRLSEIYRQQLAAVERWLSSRPRFVVLDVPYAGLVEEPALWAERVNTHVGGGLDTREMARAVDPALYRNRGSANEL
ncbi:MAG: hypothetical protein KJZ65_15405 [Phycisphaerales bacterium]|nr:hypothetical protein [Phycisphaerales bacterium]